MTRVRRLSRALQKARSFKTSCVDALVNLQDRNGPGHQQTQRARNWSDIICACAIPSVETCPAIFSDVTQKNSGVSCKEFFSGWQVCNKRKGAGAEILLRVVTEESKSRVSVQEAVEYVLSVVKHVLII